ncbi:MAG: alpha-E domain-containing protein [Chthoniobacterales bacterium]
MLSRVADSIYWMARYVERAENMARLLLSTADLLLDAGAEGADEAAFWGPILAATGEEEAYAAQHRKIKGRDVAAFLTVSRENPNSIVSNIAAARENARTVRDQISDELWECVNGLKLWLDSSEGRAAGKRQTAAFHETILRGSYRFQGIADATTPRGDGWHFFRLGTCLERADQTSRLLDSCSRLSLEAAPHPDARPLRWAALLRSCSAWHAFQTRSNRLEPEKIAAYLLLDTTFPRSVACCIDEVHAALQALCGPGARLETMADPVRQAGKLRADLAYAEMDAILSAGLHDYIDALQQRLNNIGDSVFRTFVLYADLTPVTHGPDEVAPPTAFHWPAGDQAAAAQQQ